MVEAEDEFIDEEGDEDDLTETDESSTPTVPCPACGKDVYEDADRCCHCGQYITHAAEHPSRLWWYVAFALVAAGILAYALID